MGRNWEVGTYIPVVMWKKSTRLSPSGKRRHPNPVDPVYDESSRDWKGEVTLEVVTLSPPQKPDGRLSLNYIDGDEPFR